VSPQYQRIYSCFHLGWEKNPFKKTVFRLYLRVSPLGNYFFGMTCIKSMGSLQFEERTARKIQDEIPFSLERFEDEPSPAYPIGIAGWL